MYYFRNIPILSQKNRSEARRFICLVDTLYDHKLRVVASGAAPYWELFQVRPINQSINHLFDSIVKNLVVVIEIL